MDIPETTAETQINTSSRSLLISVFFALLSLFIMLNAISPTDSEKSGKVLRALHEEFNDKDISQEFLLYQREQERPSEETFKDVITKFLDTQRQKVPTSLTETPALYMIKLNYLSFFNIDSSEPKQNAADFLVALDTYLGLNKKKPAARAEIVMFYQDDQALITKRSVALQGILTSGRNRNMSFSTIKTKDKSLDNQIYIIFSKNEF